MSGMVTNFAAPWRGVRRVMTITPQTAERMAMALLAQLDGWKEQLEEIADKAHPVTGNRARALHLMHSILQARGVLEQILKQSGEL